MPPSEIKRPTLPPHLLKQLGLEDGGGSNPNKHGAKRNGGGRIDLSSRKDRRKAEREQKRYNRYGSGTGTGSKAAGGVSAKGTTPPRSILKRPPPPPGPDRVSGTRPKPILKRPPSPESDDEDEDDDDDEDEGLIEDLEEDSDGEDEDDGVDGMDVDMGEEEETDQEPSPGKSAVPKAVRDKLAEDDAEIAELERKLGIKGRKKLPQSFKEDGLGDLLEEIDGVLEDEDVVEKRKRKAEADEWLASKRRKATTGQDTRRDTEENSADDSDEELDDLDEDSGSDNGSGGGFSEDESERSEGDFDGFDSGDEAPEEKQEPKRVRENPYVAPVTGQQATKYVPPSLRKETGSDAELAARVRRQTQGLVNRVTEANLVGITGDIEKLYRDNPRQHVSSALVDLLLIQICEPTALPDTLLILNAGFATAVYKVIGMDFGAQLIQELVERFTRYHIDAKQAAVDRPDVSKETSNLITFLAQLYNFQLVGPNLLFDFIRLLLEDLSELNAELLLRIVRMSGHSLRQDDPLALKDIVALIRPAVSKIGEQNLSVRTKFMIETIQDLKNNKVKAGATASAIVSEHSTRMRKTLGTLNSRKLKSTEPLRIGLKDLQESDKKGKWWLVGASWAGPSAGDKTSKGQQVDEDEEESEDDWLPDDLMESGPDIEELARQQMMNTDVRRSIFVAITLAFDYEDAYVRINKLRLNKERRKEIPFVVMQCVGAEQDYNSYYTLVAQKLCSDHKTKWAFQNSLWKFFKRLGESIFGEDMDDVDDTDEIPLRRLVNNAKMFGTLVADGTLSLGVLKCLNLPYLQPKTKDFVHCMLVTVLQGCLAKEGDSEAAIATVFRVVDNIPELARGLQWFLRKVIRKTDLAGTKAENKRVREAGKMAEAVVEAVLAADVGLGE